MSNHYDYIPSSEIKKKKLKIGLYFGSFNPIHNGHLILAQTAINETELDYVWLVVSPQNPLKNKKNLLPAYDRLRMVELAVDNNDRILASNVEFNLPRPSYTIHTLTHLSDLYRSYEFALIMGKDNLAHIHKWKNYKAILNNYQLHVYPRQEAEKSEYDNHPSVNIFNAPFLNLSATYIRNAIRNNKSVQYMIPETVRNYIITGGLYLS